MYVRALSASLPSLRFGVSMSRTDSVQLQDSLGIVKLPTLFEYLYHLLSHLQHNVILPTIPKRHAEIVRSTQKESSETPSEPSEMESSRLLWRMGTIIAAISET